MAIEKIKILGAGLELPARQHCQFSQFTSCQMGQMGQLCGAVYLVTPKRTQDFNFFNRPGSLIFILCEIRCYLCPPTPHFWGYNNLVLAIVSQKGVQPISRWYSNRVPQWGAEIRNSSLTRVISSKRKGKFPFCRKRDN